MCAHVRACACPCAHMFVCVHVCMPVCACLCVCTRTCACTCVPVHVCVHVFVSMCAHVCMCMCVCVEGAGGWYRVGPEPTLCRWSAPCTQHWPGLPLASKCGEGARSPSQVNTRSTTRPHALPVTSHQSSGISYNHRKSHPHPTQPSRQVGTLQHTPYLQDPGGHGSAAFGPTRPLPASSSSLPLLVCPAFVSLMSTETGEWGVGGTGGVHGFSTGLTKEEQKSPPTDLATASSTVPRKPSAFWFGFVPELAITGRRPSPGERVT